MFRLECRRGASVWLTIARYSLHGCPIFALHPVSTPRAFSFWLKAAAEIPSPNGRRTDSPVKSTAVNYNGARG
jgi:hypothetical protein